MTSLDTASLARQDSFDQAERSSDCTEDFEKQRYRAERARLFFPSIGMAVVSMASSTLIDVETWPPIACREVSTVLGYASTAPRRRVTLGEARRSALAILAESERRREAFAEEEARRTAAWEAEG